MLPEAVRKQAEEADAFIMGNTAEPTPPEQSPSAEIPAPPPSDQPQPVQTEKPPVTEQAAPAASDTPANLDDLTVDQLKSRLSVLQGKYSIENPRLRLQVSELQAQVNGLTTTVVRLENENTNLKQLAPAPAQSPAQSLTEIEQKLRDDYEPELIDGLLAILRNENASAAPEKREPEPKPSHDNPAAALASILAEQGINFDKMQSDVAFNEWLKLPDSITGVVRKDLLQGAYNQGNLADAASFFTEFVNIRNQANPQVTPPQNDLSAHVTIDSSSAPAASNAGEQMVYDDDFLPRIANQLRLREITSEQHDLWEREYFAAQKARFN